MSRHASAYEQVRDLCNTLSNATTVTARRKASEELRNLLGDAKYQSRLGRETGHDPLKIASVWRLAVANSVVAAQRLIEGARRTKITTPDLRLPGAILLLADKDSGQYLPNIFGGEDGLSNSVRMGMYGGGSGSRMAGGGAGGGMGNSGGAGSSSSSSSSSTSNQPTSLADPRCRTRLTSKEIQKLLEFCLQALADEECREEGESDLMNTLSTLCSRSDYVAHFATDKDVEYILSEIEERLLPKKGRILGGAEATAATRMAIMENAAKTLANLIYHYTVSLGCGMHMRLASCFDLIVAWCKLSSSQPRQTANQCLHYVISAATSLLLTHPDQCVPIMRENGRYILALVKKSFTLTSGQPRDVLIDYFSAHLYVCEIAGKMQGLLPGDLGDIGRASLSPSQVDSILAMLTSDKQMAETFPVIATDAAKSRKRKRQSSSGGQKIKRQGAEWSSLTRRQRRHLELSARLLYCAQRYWAAKKEVTSSSDPTDMLLFGEDAAGQDTAPLDASNSPFLLQIASKLCAKRFLPKIEETDPALTAPTATMTMTQTAARARSLRGDTHDPSDVGSFICDSSTLPMMKALAVVVETSGSKFASAPSSLVAYLRLLCACADTFPSGSCWSLDNKSWKEYQASNVVLPHTVRQKVASSVDTASIVYIALTILVSNGGASGDANVQMWALTCLLKLTGPSLFACRQVVTDKEREAALALVNVWTDVYKTLLRSDLKYASYTASAYEGSLGELVLMLLTEINSLLLADPKLPALFCSSSSVSRSNLSPTDAKIWTLPAFRDATQVQTRAPFELISQTIRRAGLLEHGSDAINRSALGTTEIVLEVFGEEEGSELHISQLAQSRRFRLLVFCLRFIQEATTVRPSDSTLRHIMPLACECATVLIGRNQTSFPTSFSFGGKSTFGVVDTARDFLNYQPRTLPMDEPLTALWRDHLMPPQITTLIADADDSFCGMLWGQMSLHHLASFRDTRDDDIKVLEKLLALSDTNIASPAQAKMLRELSVSYVKQCVINAANASTEALIMDRESATGDDSEIDAGTGDEAPVAGKENAGALATKTLISLALADDDLASCVKNLFPLEDEIASSIESSLESLSKLARNDFEASMTDLLGIFRSLLCLSSLGCHIIVRAYGANARRFYDECYRSLQFYAKRSDDGSAGQQQSPLPSNSGRASQSARGASGRYGRATSTGRAGNRLSDNSFGDFDDSDDEDFGSSAGLSRVVGGSSTTSSRMKPVDDDSDDFDDSDEEHLMSANVNRGDKRRRGGPNGSSRIPIRVHRGGDANTSRRTSSSAPEPPHPRGAWLAAAAMLVVDPSVDCCKNITECLVWPDFLNEDDQTQAVTTIDRTDALACLGLFMQSDALLRERLAAVEADESDKEDEEEETVVTMCGDIIDTVRAADQSASAFHLTGFGTIATLVQMGENYDMPKDDTRFLINLLHPEGNASKSSDSDNVAKRTRRSLRRRHRIKSHQLNAAIRAFLGGSDSFHSMFDGTYATAFVIPSICSIDSQVREVATEAVAAALKALPNQRPIVKSVIRVLAPLSLTGDEDRVKKHYNRWLKERMNVTEGESPMEFRAWQDARESMEYCSIKCRGVIAASTQDEDIARENILHLIRLSMERPSLLMPCYRACEHAAVSRGYSKLEDLFGQEREWILQELLKLRVELTYFPLIVTSSPTVRSLLRLLPSQAVSGHKPSESQYETVANNEDAVEGEDSAAIDLDRLEGDAASQYVDAVASTLIPLIVLESPKISSDVSNDDDDDEEIEQGWSKDAWKLMEDASTIIKGGKSDGDISTVLKNHIHDIYALLFPIFQCSEDAGGISDDENALDDEADEDERQATKKLVTKKAAGAIGALKGVISEEIISKQAARISHLVVREALRLNGRRISFGKYSLPSPSFLSAIEYVSSGINSGTKSTSGLFESAGSSSTECLLDARGWMDQAATRTQEQRSWQVIECICDQTISELDKTKSQMGFVMHTLLSILLDVRFEILRPQVLSKLFDVMATMLRSEKGTIDWNDDQTLLMMNEILPALVYLHETYQSSIVKASVDSWRRGERESKRIKGLLPDRSGAGLGNDDGGDVWGWDRGTRAGADAAAMDATNLGVDDIVSALARSNLKTSRPTAFEAITKIYDLLELILLKSPEELDSVFAKIDPLPTSSLSKDEIDALTKENFKFSLTALLLRFNDRKGETVASNDDLSSCDIEHELERFLSLFRRHQFGSDSSESGAHGVHLRSLVSGLSRLEQVFALSPLKDSAASEISFGPLLYKTIQVLFKVCHDNYPSTVRVASSRCIGELSSFDLTSFRNLTATHALAEKEGGEKEELHHDPVVTMELTVFRLLANYFKSPNSETAIAAKDTAKFLIRTREGQRCWKKMDLDDEIRHLLGPLAVSGRKLHRSDLPELDKKYIERLYQKSGDQGDINGETWCWNQGLWGCPEGGETSYEEWIRDLVCSIILCRYSCGRKHSASEAKSSSTEGAYFHCLLPMCAREAEFAASIFPGLVFDLLSSDDTKGNSRSNDAIRSEVCVGESDSETNRILTRCFSFLINPSLHTPGASQEVQNTATTETNTKALEIIVDTLDSLRRVVQHRWMTSPSHKKNTIKLPTKKADPSGKSKRAAKRKRATDESLDDSQYTADLPAPPEWLGVPFGIVLHLSGLDVARACLRANRYASALFYSEMFADNRFGGSGGIFERLSKNDSSSCRDASIDISGFGLHSESASDSVADSRIVLELSDITKKCLSQFRESDGLEGIQTQDAAIRFYHDAGGTLMAQEGPSDIPSSNDWGSLLALDMRQQRPQRTEYSSNALAITSHLKTVGLRHIMKQYMVGLEGSDDLYAQDLGASFSATSRQETEAKLKDQWFEESWRTLQWDDTLLSPASDDSGSPTLTAGIHSGGPTDTSLIRGRYESEIAWSGGGLNHRGMNECINIAFNSALDEESDSHSKAVRDARQALLDKLCSSVGNESLMAALPDYSTKLMALNEVDKMKGGMFENLQQPVSSALKVIGYTDDDADISSSLMANAGHHVGFQPNVGFSSLEFLMSIREVALRVSAQKRPEDASLLRSALTSHLFGFSALARQCNRPEVAGTCLQRLRNVMEVSESSSGDTFSKLHSSLRVHLEDARLDSAKGNFGSAIRTCKLVLNKMKSSNLSGTADSVKEQHRAVMSDAGILCGDLMVEYKVESGKTILQDYLKPASSMALKVYEKNKSVVNGQRAAQSQFALAAFVASLHDNVVEKVKSQEWKRARVTADERRAELAICNKMLEKANKENAEIKSKPSARSGTARTGAQSRTKQTLEEMTRKEHRELVIHVNTLKKELKMEEKERKTVERAVSEYLHLAIESFAKALSIHNPSTMTEDVSKHIFRMVSLWFANSTNSGVNELMRQYQDSVSTHHFVPLTYQIFARIDSAGEGDASDFQATLRSLVLKMCTDHPYHCLIQLITLANGSKVGASDAPGRTNAYLQYGGNSKVDASVSILESLKRLKGSSSYVASLVESYIAISNGYIDLAMFPTSKFHGDKKDKSKPPPKKIALSVAKSGGGRSTEKSLDQILSSGGKRNFKCAPCVLTKPPMLRPGRDYGHGNDDPIGSERIETFDPNFSITDTGIHRPKIVKCIGSKGGIFKQLVKGEDDIRQDAVMQQVFSTVNNLLRSPRISSTSNQSGNGGGGQQRSVARSLNLVTYNIIPLSPVSGVLEWVDDTMPFGDFLNDKGGAKSDRIGAHSRYFPGEWSNRLCQTYFMEAPTHERRKAFDEICKRISPAFRYFFVERFAHSLQAWHTARTTYTRSVAVNSIVGHVLGIGDRHCNNILVHQKTGEVVHIDFGIVFEQGKCLNTPETVPFRLTRDVVDGMGPSGTDGCFSLSAEATASVLRDNAETLLTILSAVVSDPLYKWSMSPLQARKVQRAGARNAGDDDDDEDADEDEEEDADGALASAIGKQTSSAMDENNDQNQNEAATRAIQKIHQKLQGYEEGNTGERQSVEGQVQLLINEARDPDNLCMLYHGWAPWC